MLREIFSLGEIEIYESNSDSDNFFLKVNSLKRFLVFAGYYYFDYMGVDRGLYLNVKFVDLRYMDIWELMDYYMLVNSEFFIDYGIDTSNENLVS